MEGLYASRLYIRISLYPMLMYIVCLCALLNSVESSRGKLMEQKTTE